MKSLSSVLQSTFQTCSGQTASGSSVTGPAREILGHASVSSEDSDKPAHPLSLDRAPQLGPH